MNAISERRKQLIATLFPNEVPRLWCPTLTHFRAFREYDVARIRSHVKSLSSHVRGILVPGSTGEGWEMSDDDIRHLMGIVLEAARENQIHVLIGVLKTTMDEVAACVESIEDLRNHPAVVGITVCPPKGSELSQSQIRTALASVLSRGWPTALYQLPQVTQNEMNPETAASLAGEFENFILFKDTSGLDRVANSGCELGGVFMVRGSEQGGYFSWPRSAGGAYDGYLLSSANVFSKQLHEILLHLEQGDTSSARHLSDIVSDVISRVFSLVSQFPFGNQFANANKALDHCMAFGKLSAEKEPPMLYGGARLSKQFVVEAMAILSEYSLLPDVGYAD